MAGNGKERVIVVLSLSGGNDGVNTVIPYANPLYRDYRLTIGVPENQILHLNDEVGFHPSMVELKQMFDEGKVAVIQGVGYPHPSLSHFRSMDIWNTCEPDKIAAEGWLGRAIKQMDPNGENVLAGVNIGRGLPRAFVAPGVAIASVGDLATYGVLTGISAEEQRSQALEVFAHMYAPAIGSGPVMDYLRETGIGALKGADILKTAPQMYSSTVEYGNYPIAQGMRDVAQVHLADLGTRILYNTSPYNAFDTHSNEARDHSRLWGQVSRTVADFFADLREHNQGEEVLLFMFSEFGRRARDNGSGTDHGTGSVCFVIGDHVKGGLYGEYPSLKQDDMEDGNLRYKADFRSVYTEMLEGWLGLDAKPIIGGTYEKLGFL
jgi:uncharacterized protein (DUF1501 family)